MRPLQQLIYKESLEQGNFFAQNILKCVDEYGDL